MAGVLDAVNSRTQMVGQNRLELLLFKLGSSQMYGINVFKVKEVLQCPKLTMMPKLNPVVRGVAHIRGGTIPILDLSMATGSAPLPNIENSFVIISEYNRTVQGFLVSSVERIVNTNWESIHPPPSGTGKESYLTAVTEIEGQLVEIIDVEKVIAEVVPSGETISEEILGEIPQEEEDDLGHILIVDDSSVARKQVQKCMESVGLETTLFKNGAEALNHLKSLVEQGVNPADKYIMMISDIEMPEMDGYTLTSAVKGDPQMSELHIMLHTSLSGVFNHAMVEKVGADDFMAKFSPDNLASKAVNVLKGVYDPVYKGGE
ncbi:chemotaxis protein CheV [Litoribrevibacter euphylliae]|uniref:Chemotaxis protein CheV n=1 Tax=Litoribrevibacter euphylliae TaxID=1834034 RepID=A0ABV7H7Z6_9GAMM